MVAGVTTFAKSIDQSVEDKLAADPALKKQWEEVSSRFHFVFANPEAAFRKVDVDAMMTSAEIATSTLATLKDRPRPPRRRCAWQGVPALRRGPGRLASAG